MIKAGSGKQLTEIRLSDEQRHVLKELTGQDLSKLVVETEPFDNPPLGTTVLGKIFTDPRTKVVARVNARFG